MEILYGPQVMWDQLPKIPANSPSWITTMTWRKQQQDRCKSSPLTRWQRNAVEKDCIKPLMSVINNWTNNGLCSLDTSDLFIITTSLSAKQFVVSFEKVIKGVIELIRSLIRKRRRKNMVTSHWRHLWQDCSNGKMAAWMYMIPSQWLLKWFA